MEKIRLAYLTTLKEIIGDEHVGCIVIDGQNGHNFGYRRGNLEAIAEEVSSGKGEFADTFELAGVIVNDSHEDITRFQSMVSRWPFDLQVPINTYGPKRDVVLQEMLDVVPAGTWRSVKDPERKRIEKRMYEAQILLSLIRNRVDVVVSDSYNSVIERTLLDHFGGIILNIHPAILAPGDPARLPGITPTFDAYTRAEHGFVVVDNKRNRSIWPNSEGETVQYEYQGRVRTVQLVPKSHVTGVTIHVVDEELDHGPVIMDAYHNFAPGTTIEGIRTGNYDIKLNLLPKALLEYARRDSVRALIEAQRAKSQIYRM